MTCGPALLPDPLILAPLLGRASFTANLSGVKSTFSTHLIPKTEFYLGSTAVPARFNGYINRALIRARFRFVL